jgi:cell wall-associated NlpC family hydrolase
MSLLVRSLRAARTQAASVLLVLTLTGVCLVLPGTASSAAAATNAAGKASASQAVLGKRAVAVASRLAGVPYRYGGTTTRGFDCSGFTRYVYARVGASLPRVSHAQYVHSRKVGKNVRPGDLVFFYNSSGRIYHAAIYAGSNRIWHSPKPGSRVRLDRIWSSRWTGGRYALG